MVLATGSASRATDPDTKMLDRVVRAVAANYLAPVSSDDFARSIEETLNAADDKDQQLLACEQHRAPAPSTQNPPWLDRLEAAAQCSRAVRGESEAKPVLDAAVSRALSRLDSRFRFLGRIGGWGGRNDYLALIGPRAHPGMIGIAVAKPEAAASEIVWVMPDGPAARAGIAAGDRILTIGGEPVSRLTLDEILYRVLAPAGSVVDLQVRRQKGAIENVRVTTVPKPATFDAAGGGGTRITSRQTAESMVPTSSRSELRDGILILTIPRMVTGQTEDEVRGLLHAGMKAPTPPKAILLDLRHNPEGQLDSTADIADLFLESGPIMRLQGRTIGDAITTAHRKAAVPADMPLFVLIDESGGGAAEILAAALADAGRATLIGRPTKSEGVVHTLIFVRDDRAISIPQGTIYRANGRPLGDGLQPAVSLEPDADDAAELDGALRAIGAKMSGDH
jgi:carboxyl-terminal processing protease